MNKPRILFSVLAPVLLLLVAGVLATLAQPHPQPAEAAWPAAPAATLTVDTAVDENDGSCNDGDCSLRDA
ncbi:MAG: hypothetical protein JXD18_04600, partial [Anaerolineae bacterium]|nr:hypothetical protein [Anaerolineae bacterium]